MPWCRSGEGTWGLSKSIHSWKAVLRGEFSLPLFLVLIWRQHHYAKAPWAHHPSENHWTWMENKTFGLHQDMPAPVSLIAEEPCKCPDPSSYQRSHHSVESQPGSPLFHLLILIIALQPENTPRAVMKTLGRSHGCSASADSWPDQERM